MGKTTSYHRLKDKWVTKHKQLHAHVIKKHKDISHLTSFKRHLIGSILFTTAPFFTFLASVSAQMNPLPVPTPIPKQHITKQRLIETLKEMLPSEVVPLDKDQERDIAAVLSASYYIHVVPEIDGKRLNRSYGLIGQEQHLKRFPGDNLDTHFETDEDAHLHASKGMAPGLGAWGYFAQSQADLTKLDIEREKYYIAVPTFLSPGWNERVGEYGIFYKYRKMLVVNPENGKAIVADIADAGPAPFTEKHLGGSPEVMRYLERVDGAQKGPVLYFFVDESDNSIKLGPVTL